ncbi:SxtJ family membrane protein [Paucibacter sp. DJ2R-2]|uniref:SxtJ family membrane protein n=1 Tax=Paucibacter sp. DJ2R-2 TaxID=2893558 RepID=UPI0021E396D1|nr:SxtJ family membrane protein [Paucibacter sp. DJ2R-2]MCV2423113.1 SxtJ family membrane protein [Paucibacter sp. DJ4R-1]MCV2441008.1 SxtJ family membrane protein [Paucibacter sp. DJ2R-2]
MTHEQTRDEDGSASASDRAFGLVMAAVFLIIASAPLWFGGAWRIWALFVVAILVGAAAVAPSLLAPLNRLWSAFGEVLRKLTTPLILAFIFFVVLTPIGLLMRLLGKDLLRLRFDRAAPSYWLSRTPPGPPPESFKDQF